jgi:hypothetical protein
VCSSDLGWLAASKMMTNGEVASAETDAMNIFCGNIIISNVPTDTCSTPDPNLFTLNTTGSPSPTAAVVTKTGPALTSTVTFSANVPTTFMKVVGYKQLTVTGSSSASSSLPLYLDFYVALDVSGSMGMPSTASEAQRLQYLNPDNNVDYPTGCTLACHFAPQGVCVNPTTPPQLLAGQSGYPVNSTCLGYAISRVSQSGFKALRVQQSSQKNPPYTYRDQDPNSATFGQYLQLPTTMVSGLPNSLYTALPPVSSCPTAGTDNCIQLRLDAVGFALNATQPANGVSGLFETAKNVAVIPQQFRIGLYPFIQNMITYFPLTNAINGSPTNSSTINFAAANIATLLDTNTNANLGSGGTNITLAMTNMNSTITSVGDGSASNKTLPYVFLITDGAVDPQTKQVNQSGGWAGSNHATVISSSPSPCAQLTSRGIKVMVLYIPYVPINPVNSKFANDEDDFANNNIQNIQNSLQSCASPTDSSGSYLYVANSPAQINQAIVAMFNHALVTAHITN